MDVRYFDQEGSHRQRTFDKKKDADAFKTRIESDALEGHSQPAAGTETVADVCELFVKAQEGRKRDGRIGRGRHENIVRGADLAIILFKTMALREVGGQHVEDWYEHMCRVRKFTPRTALGHVALFSMVCSYAKRERLIRDNPVDDARPHLRGVSDVPIRTFTRDEIQRILIAATGRGRRCHERVSAYGRCMIHLSAFCGLRFGEILGLTVDAVDLGKRLLRVRSSLTPFDELKGPKTASGNRDVPIPKHLVSMLHDWMRRFYVANDRNLLFRTHTGRRISSGSFHAQYWTPLLARAELPRSEKGGYHSHALRHFAASWFIENGMSLIEVAPLLGHKEFDMTLRVYAHPVVGGTRRNEALDHMADRLLEGAETQILTALPGVDYARLTQGDLSH